MSKRELGWVSKDGTMTRVCDMDDAHLLNAIDYLRRKIMAAQLATGVVSCSKLTLEYLLREASDRGLSFYGSADRN